MSLKTAVDHMGKPDEVLVNGEGKVVGGMWIHPRLRHDHADRVAERERGEVCTCLDCEMKASR